MMQKTLVAVALGTNLGDRLGFLKQAVERLGEEFLDEMSCSQVFESQPWGITDQPQFLNMVVRGTSEWKPPAIVNFLKNLEREIGRTQNVKNGPREIDLDLIAYGEMVWSSEGVSVPHPRLAERSFVLLPLAQVWPAWRHPQLKRSATELCAELSETQLASSKAIGPLPQDTTNR